MATLPIIPRNDGEGSLGIETKQWGDIQTKKINGVDIETLLDIDVTAVDKLGINTTANDTNKLSINSDASLFNHNGTGHQLKINKNSESDTASILYQSNFTGFAELGLNGNNDLSIKVSNGSTWITAITINKNTGEVEFPETNIKSNSTGSDLYMYFNFDNYAM